MFKSLQSALFASFVGLIILSLMVFASLATPRIKNATVNQISYELSKQMKLVRADLSKMVMYKYSQSRIQSKVVEIAKLSKSRVTVISVGGEVLADSSTPLTKIKELENHGDRPEILQSKEKYFGKAVRYSNTLKKDLIYTAIPLKSTQNEIIGYLRFSVPSTYATELVVKMHKSMAVALFLAVLVAITVSILFSRNFSRPIIRLAGISRRIAGGEVPVKITHRSKFELGKLEDTMQQMSQRLAEAFQKLSAEHERLKKLEHYRSEFVANVSHELKTPLTAIRSYVETLLNGAIDDKEHNLEFLKKIERRAANLSYLIDDLLEISHLESRNELGGFTQVDLNQIVGRAIEMAADKSRGKGVVLERKLLAEPILIMGNEEHIYRAILNLLDNAINYTNQNGKVEIYSEKKTDKVEISIADTGIGIPQEHLKRIFERFYRVDKARSRELGGTGLGLSIVKHVMNIHHGSVLVESVLGKGTKFTLVFPS